MLVDSQLIMRYQELNCTLYAVYNVYLSVHSPINRFADLNKAAISLISHIPTTDFRDLKAAEFSSNEGCTA